MTHIKVMTYMIYERRVPSLENLQGRLSFRAKVYDETMAEMRKYSTEDWERCPSTSTRPRTWRDSQVFDRGLGEMPHEVWHESITT